MKYNTKYTKELLNDIVKGSQSLAEVIRKLGLREAGGNYSHIKKRIKQYGLDISHFKHFTDFLMPGVNKKFAKDVLVLRKSGCRQKSAVLRRALIESGVEYKCVCCKIKDKYNELPIVLEVNHKNNNWLDDRNENIEFRCPNCHSQYVRVV